MSCWRCTSPPFGCRTDPGSFDHVEPLYGAFDQRKRKRAQASRAAGLPFVVVIGSANSDVAYDWMAAVGALRGRPGLSVPRKKMFVSPSMTITISSAAPWRPTHCCRPNARRTHHRPDTPPPWRKHRRPPRLWCGATDQRGTAGPRERSLSRSALGALGRSRDGTCDGHGGGTSQNARLRDVHVVSSPHFGHASRDGEPSGMTRPPVGVLAEHAAGVAGGSPRPSGMMSACLTSQSAMTASPDAPGTTQPNIAGTTTTSGAGPWSTTVGSTRSSAWRVSRAACRGSRSCASARASARLRRLRHRGGRCVRRARPGRLLRDAGIVRNRGKIEATIANARAALELRQSGESLAALIWQYEPVRTPAQEVLRAAGQHCRVDRAVEGPPQAWVPLRRTNNRVLGDAGLGVVNDHLAGCASGAAADAERAALIRPQWRGRDEQFEARPLCSWRG